jgi:hypothetical protein
VTPSSLLTRTFASPCLSHEPKAKVATPIVLTYVIIDHKAQGVIITFKVIVHIRKSFAPSLTDVILSRVTNHANLIIQSSLKPLNFICFDQCL